MKYPDNVIWRPQAGSQEAFLSATPIFEVLYQGTRGGGKCIADRTLVLTTKGWKKAEAITQNDLLIAEDGSPTKILGIFPQPKKRMFEVEFSDGQKIVCGEDHRWKVGSGKNFVSQGWRVKDTLYLADEKGRGRKFRNGGRKHEFIPFMTNASQHGEIYSGPDPYILGLIVGDGTINNRNRATIYNQDEEILDYLAARGWKINRYENSVPRATQPAKDEDTWAKALYDCLPGAGKRFPKEIIQADPTTRLRALQGLMDADGSVDEAGRCGLATISPYLMEQVQELAWSLGGKAGVSLKQFSNTSISKAEMYFSISISTHNSFNPFSLSRKAERVKNHLYTKMLHRAIVNVKECEWEPSRCFAVDHPSHCFIIEGYVVTHNTDCLLMSFGMFTGRGFGAAWKGILFRQTYKQLTDVITKTKKWFPQIWPEAKFNHSEHVWTWPGGEQLLLRQFKKADDYWNYHGHEYPWIGWEELCNWATDDGFKRMFSCCRSSTKGMPRMIRATTNPYGPGHNWVKARYLPDRMNMKVRKDLVDEEGRPEPTRLSIFSRLQENKILLETDPEYINKIAAAARNNAEKKAWLEGSWDVVSGGMFDDVFDPDFNIVKPFKIPANWRIDRSFDWGSSHPFSVGWWAVSNGEDVQLEDGTWRSTIKGDLFRIAEWYGWTGKPNEGARLLASDITRGIVQRELKWGWRDARDPSWCRVKTGVADSQIFAAENGNCIATDMANKVRLDSGIIFKGVKWIPADKRPGSRVTGWDQVRNMLKNAQGIDGLPREKPGLFVFDTCDNWIRTVPVLPRDETELDDVNTEAEDHIADEMRYRVRFAQMRIGSGKTSGTH